MKISPTLVSGYLALASVYQRVGDKEKTKAILERGLAANPEDKGLATRLKDL